MNKSVLIIENSDSMQSFLQKAFDLIPDFTVCGKTNTDGDTINLIKQHNPDTIIFDIENSETGNLKILENITECYPEIPVLVFNSRSQQSASHTMQSLALGAKDYLTKPVNAELTENCEAFVRTQLAPKLGAIFNLNGAAANNPYKKEPEVRNLPPTSDNTHKKESEVRSLPPTSEKNLLRKLHFQPQIVVIGASLGGPEALTTLLALLPQSFPLPILTTLHMPAKFTSKFAERLNSKTKLQVEEGYENASVEPGKIWIAPGDYHMKIKANGPDISIHLNQGPLINSCRPAIDPLFESAVQCFGGHVLGVILTGTGFDGTEGCRNINDAGGYVLAQDERSSSSWSMPGNVVKKGYAHQVGSLEELSYWMARQASHNNIAQQNSLERN